MWAFISTARNWSLNRKSKRSIIKKKIPAKENFSLNKKIAMGVKVSDLLNCRFNSVNVMI